MDWDGGHEWAFWDRSLVYAIDRFVNPGYADQILKGWSSEAFTQKGDNAMSEPLASGCARAH